MPAIPWKLLPRTDITKYDSIPMYMYTEKDGLNRVTVLKETSKEIYLVAGRKATTGPQSRIFKQLIEEERGENERNNPGWRKKGREKKLKRRVGNKQKHINTNLQEIGL